MKKNNKIRTLNAFEDVLIVKKKHHLKYKSWKR
jgi:hypothetical protein